ncbi:MAG: glycerol-3-phosphate 1-O-acyltransferase PlsY [Hyphomonadaceae bacterium]|nr:glycerol-3-phosphate 1-O-acyltransferase PlsY [Hyphomonadaceae bacterium]
MLSLALAALGGYLLGSIPFGLLLTRAAGLGDIRNVGSGNIGATNVLRTGRRDIAFATLVLDAGKAAAALLIAREIAGPEAGFVAGGAAFLGHCFPVWLGFKGGKGVATFFGVLFAGLWPVALVAAAAWLATAAIARISSLGALVAAASAPIAAAAFNLGPWAIGFCALLAVLIFWRHQPNIQRLLRGEEPRIGAKS